jgi:tetratricopeptide (TPR) repeat protein
MTPTPDQEAHSTLRDTAQKLTTPRLTNATGAGDDLRAVLEEARIVYIDGRTGDAAQNAESLVTRLRTMPSRTAGDEEILGSACTLLGLILCMADDGAHAQHHFAEAVEAFTNAGPATAKRGTAAADYGIALQHTGAHQAAKKALRKALKLGTDTPDVRRHLGAALRDLGQRGRAEKTLADAVARAALDWQAREWLAALHEDLGNDASEVSREWEETGRLLCEAGLIRHAAQAYQRALRLRPADAGLLITTATVLASAGEKAESVKALLDGVKLPISAAARLKLADLLVELEQSDAAVKVYRAIIESGPDDDLAAVGLASALILQGGENVLDEAKRILLKTVRAHPDSVKAWALLGEVARVQGHHKKAIRHFDKALAIADETDSANAFLHGSKGQALRQLGRREQAVEELRRAAETDSDLPWVHTQLAELYRESAEFDAEISELRQALRLQAMDAAVLTSLGIALAEKAQRQRVEGKYCDDIAAEAESILVRIPPPGCFQPRVLEPLTNLLLIRGDKAAALAALEQAELAMPDDLDILTVHARFLYRIGRHEDAAELLATALGKAPERWRDRALLGDIERVRGDLPAALEQLDRVIAAQPHDMWSLSSRAAVYLAMGEAEQAEQDLRHCLDTDPCDLFSLRILRNLLISQRRYTEAVTAFHDASERCDASQEMLREYGETMRQAGRYADAREILDEALWKDPQDEWTRRALGWLLLDMHQPKEALANFELAAQSSHDPAAWHEAFTALIFSGRYEEAMQRLNQWLATHLEDGEAWRLTGWLYLRVGAWHEGLTAAEQAVRFSPDNAHSHDLHGWAILRADWNPCEALHAFTNAIRLGPSNPWLHKGYAYAQWTAGHEDEARAACEKMLDLLRYGRADAEVASLRGWCLAYLGCQDEAITEYTKALAMAEWEPSGIAFRLAFAHMMVGDEADAESALAHAWRVLDDEPSLRRRGIVAASLADLKVAKRVIPRMRNLPILKKTERRMAAYVTKCPAIWIQPPASQQRSGVKRPPGSSLSRKAPSPHSRTVLDHPTPED